ncbi:MAG: saccharopine dehydrogenase NADP-binding domain-containing protein [Cyanobacteria bacterium P01_F01_bin.42]
MRESGGRILIIGGYGHVGQSIAVRLASLFPNRVTVAGRNLDKARTTAREIGHGTEECAIDIFGTDTDAVSCLDSVSLVIVCLDQSNTRFVEQCLSRGIHYVDISADYPFLLEVEQLHSLAERSGATAMLSVGVAPGLTNLLAARAQEQMERTDRIDIILEFGLGDRPRSDFDCASA